MYGLNEVGNEVGQHVQPVRNHLGLRGSWLHAKIEIAHG